MSDVLHFIDARCGADALLEATILAGGADRLICIGPPPEALSRPGQVRRIPPVRRGRFLPAGPTVHGSVRTVLEGRAIAHCWSIRAAEALALPNACPDVVIRLGAAPGKEGLDRLSRWGPRARPVVVCAHQADAETIVRAEVPADVRVIAPAACRLPAGPTERPRLREGIGIAPDEVAVAAPGSAGRDSGHRLAVWAVAILVVAEVRVRLVVQDAGRGGRAVLGFARETGFGERVTLAGGEVSPGGLFQAADVAVFLGRDWIPPAHLTCALCAGLPIVAADTSAARRWLAGGDNALLVPPDHPRATARALWRLIDDPDLARRLGQAGRSAARQRSDTESIRRQWDDLYAGFSAVDGRSRG